MEEISTKQEENNTSKKSGISIVISTKYLMIILTILLVGVVAVCVNYQGRLEDNSDADNNHPDNPNNDTSKIPVETVFEFMEMHIYLNTTTKYDLLSFMNLNNINNYEVVFNVTNGNNQAISIIENNLIVTADQYGKAEILATYKDKNSTILITTIPNRDSYKIIIGEGYGIYAAIDYQDTLLLIDYYDNIVEIDTFSNMNDYCFEARQHPDENWFMVYAHNRILEATRKRVVYTEYAFSYEPRNIAEGILTKTAFDFEEIGDGYPCQ